MSGKSIALDIGGYLGDYLHRFSDLGCSEVFCFEPLFYRECVDVSNTLNQKSNIKIHLFDEVLYEDGVFHIKKDGDSSSLFISSGTETKSVNGKSVKTFVDQQELNHIDYIKINCEGCEYKILEDILTLNITFDELAVQFHPHLINDLNNEKRDEILNAFRKEGYLTYAHKRWEGDDIVWWTISKNENIVILSKHKMEKELVEMNRQSIRQNKNILRLVSYPRSGSHWFRVVIEQYLERPSFPREFKRQLGIEYKSNKIWSHHIHDRFVGRGDEGLVKNLNKVIYLYRNPIDVIYSMAIYQDNTTLNWKVYADEYKKHLERWLHNNSDCGEILLVTYDRIKENPIEVFGKILKFIGEDVDEGRLKQIFDKTTKELVNCVTSKFDSKVVNNGNFDGIYLEAKKSFVEKHGEEIKEMFSSVYDESKSI